MKRSYFTGSRFQFSGAKIIGRSVDEIPHHVGGVCKPYDCLIINIAAANEAGEFPGLRLVAIKPVSFQAPGQFSKSGGFRICCLESIGTRWQLPAQPGQFKAIAAVGADDNFGNVAVTVRHLEAASGSTRKILGLGPLLGSVRQFAEDFRPGCRCHNAHLNCLVAATRQENFSGIDHLSARFVSWIASSFNQYMVNGLLTPPYHDLAQLFAICMILLGCG